MIYKKGLRFRNDVGVIYEIIKITEHTFNLKVIKGTEIIRSGRITTQKVKTGKIHTNITYEQIGRAHV